MVIKAVGKNQAGRVIRTAILYRMIREGCTEVTFEQNPEGGEKASYVNMKEEAFQAELTARAKALRQHLVWCTENSREAKMV